MSPDSLHSQTEGFWRKGVVFPFTVLTPDEVSSALRSVATLEEGLNQRGIPIPYTHLHFRWAYNLVLHPRILDIVEALIGRDILVWGTLVIAKPPHDSGFVSWHQDGTYTEFEPDRFVSAWVAFTESSPQNGCLRVVPGSHTHRRSHIEIPNDDNLLSRGQHVALEVREDDVLDVCLRPGEMSLHHLNLIHGSAPNKSASPRIGFVIRYATPRLTECAFRVIRARGCEHVRHLPLLETPPSADWKQALQSCEGNLTGPR